ncbi:unnamed protein product [Chironomus riparius]|uniref:Uncharacterized protein n=1 Tax=Chironomus riparius TaxID=315576 RepID=A0A9N9RT12_9DIPT|nr:unnamed protein product [Chironomus riparius]
MSKLLIFLASVALASCAQIDLHEHMMNQRQQQSDMKNFQNERIREHQELTHQQRQSQLEQLNDQRLVHDQMIRDHEQERLDHARENQHQRHNVNQVFVPHQHQQTPVVIHLQPAFVNIPSSTRHLNVHDDSNYDYKYAVTDMMTGDMKTHKEARRGDEVQGQYTILDSDGYHRTVNYRANDRDGFDAEVRREPAYPVLSYAQNYNGFTNYQGHHNQHNFNNDNNQQQWNYSQQVHFIPQPISVASTSVTKVDDGHQNQYSTKTTTV